ncbi:hypothetical protein [Phaeovulum sp. W22_SRMD_FR3]|uniref:hypothetical protein n=1 Tax=Phaeovulum sp. W22_SRMD_FR3 TaxID=3240274 RepID=UPI003F98B811
MSSLPLAAVALIASFAAGAWWQAAALAAAQDARIRAEINLRAKEDAIALSARDLEDQAHAQPATAVCLPLDRVRRLNLR